MPEEMNNNIHSNSGVRNFYNGGRGAANSGQSVRPSTNGFSNVPPPSANGYSNVLGNSCHADLEAKRLQARRAREAQALPVHKKEEVPPVFKVIQKEAPQSFTKSIFGEFTNYLFLFTS